MIINIETLESRFSLATFLTTLAIELTTTTPYCYVATDAIVIEQYYEWKGVICLFYKAVNILFWHLKALKRDYDKSENV